ncbi:MAG TPA: hypothetical protein VFS92_01565 [Planctomycetota bacterium]|nr:hypothetical protein [Planctomycetota bacterium]
MRRVLVLALAVLAAAPAAAGCARKRAAEGERPKEYASRLELDIKDYRVVWTRGGRQGYLQTFDAREGEGPTVTLHKVLDNDFREMGWIANDGKGERFVYPPRKVGEALRTAFQREPLPVDSIENQVRRCLGIEPTVEIALTAASDADLKKQ